MLLDLLKQPEQSPNGKPGALPTMRYGKAVLQDLSDAMDRIARKPLDTFEECNELFLDLAENYRKEGRYTGYLEPAAEVAEQFEESYNADQMQSALEAFEQQLARFEGLLRNCLSAGIFADLLLPGAALENVVVAFQ